MFANISLGASHMQKYGHHERRLCLQSLVAKKNNIGILGGYETHGGNNYTRLVCMCVWRGEGFSHKTRGEKNHRTIEFQREIIYLAQPFILHKNILGPQ